MCRDPAAQRLRTMLRSSTGKQRRWTQSMTSSVRLDIRGFAGEAVPNQFIKQESEADRLAILLPGMGYSCDMPLFYYAQNVLEERGADVLRVEYAYGHRPDVQGRSAEDQRRRLLENAGAAYRAGLDQRRYRQLTLIGKSIGTLAMGRLLGETARPDADLSAVWLTPLIRNETLLAQMKTCQVRSLIAIGGGDPHFDPALLRELRSAMSAELVIVDEADHGLDIPCDVAGSIAAVASVIAALERFLKTDA